MGSEAVYEIYIDVLYGNYVVMNYLTLTLTGMILKRSATRLRRLLIAMLSAGLGLTGILIPEIPDAVRAVWGFGVCEILALILTYRFTVGDGLLYGVGCMYLLTFLYGGCFSFLEQRFPYLKTHGYTLASVMVCGYLGYVLLRKLVVKIGKKSGEQDVLYRVRFVYKGREYACKALYDTGNRLYEPLRKKPVCIIEDRILSPEKEQLEAAIPYHSVGCKHGMMYGVYVNDFCIRPVDILHCADTCKNGKRDAGKETQNRVNGVLLAIYPGKLSATDSYEMILHPALKELAGGDCVIGKGD